METLEKAKAALDAGRQFAPEYDVATMGRKEKDVAYIEHLEVARVQATIAQAEALQRLCDILEHRHA